MHRFTGRGIVCSSDKHTLVLSKAHLLPNPYCTIFNENHETCKVVNFIINRNYQLYFAYGFSLVCTRTCFMTTTHELISVEFQKTDIRVYL